MNTQPGPWLQVEISAACQAGCIDCARWVPQGGWDQWEQGTVPQFHLNSANPHINQVYDVARWRDHIQMFDPLKHVNLCGNMGDPMAHPHIAEVCKIIQQYHAHASISISTNGGIGSVNNYVQLAELDVCIHFAIDGLEDTNHIYRRGVDWHKVKQRFTAFIDAGGTAKWQWVDFPHTRHQIDRARQLFDDF